MSSGNGKHQDIINHLEFLGYEVENLNAESGYLYIARSANKSNLMVRIIDNMTILTTRWGGFDIRAVKSKDFFIAINTINQQVMSKWYYEEDEEKEDVTIVIEADYYDYNKTTFGSFVENLEKEVSTNLQQFAKFYKEK
jgi:hypothetical protein